jgi:hypothetical protein
LHVQPADRSERKRIVMASIRSGRLRLDLIEDAGWLIEDDAPVEFRRRLLPSAAAQVPDLLGRSDEFNLAARAVRIGSPLEYYSPCGYGRTILLRHLAGRLPSILRVPAVYLDTRGQPLADLPQRVVHTVLEAEQPARATPFDARWMLDRIAPLVLLDDVNWNVQDTERALNELAGCYVILASDRPLLGERGRSRALRGLSREAALVLLAHDLGRALSGAEQRAATRLAGDLDGKPISLRQAAAAVRTGRATLEELAERVGRDPTSLDRLSTGGLTDGGRRTLAALAVVGGVALPADVVAVVSGVAQTVEALGELQNRALIDEHEDRFGLPRCAAEVRRASLLSYLDLGAAARDLADRLDGLDHGDLTGADAVAVLEATVSLVGYAADQRDWQTVIQLVRVVEPILTIAGRWETALRVLSLGARAASALGDTLTEADFLHQSGTLAFGLGDPETALSDLTRALELRRNAADWVGVEVTGRNLSRTRAAMAVPPARRRTDHRSRTTVSTLVAVAVATLAVLGIGIAAVAGRAGTPRAEPTVTGEPSPDISTSPPTPSAEPSTKTSPPTTTPPSSSPGQPTGTLRAPVISLRGTGLRAHVGGDEGSEERSRPFTVRNPNSGPLTLEPIAVTGSDAFSVIDDCPRSLAAAATCTGRVTLDPEDIGSHEGILRLSDTTGLTTTSPLSGIGYLELTISRSYRQGDATVSAGRDKTVTATLDGRTTTCPDACTVRVSDEAHQTVSLSAAPRCTTCGSDPWQFISWSIPACAGQPTCDVAVGKDAEVTALFASVVG